MKSFRLLMALLLLLSAGCSLPFQPGGLLAAQTTPTLATPTETAPASSSPAPSITVTPKQVKGPLTLHIWLPPQLDPASGTKEGNLLKQRLEEFKARRPGILLDVRIKALDGSGGLLDMLSTANAAAPSILPDLVALPRPMMEAAALKGLLHPFDGLTTVLDNSDWYDYALQLAHLQKSTFGLPFAGDALILIYRPSVVGDPPKRLSNNQAIKGPLAFPAGDPQSLFTLLLYQSAGGSVQDEQGRPSLDPAVLAQVLSFYQNAGKGGDVQQTEPLVPAWLSNYDTDDQSWSAFMEGKANLVVTWASRFLKDGKNLPEDAAAATLPNLEGSPYTLATGWVWALAGNQIQNQAAAVQLAEFLTDGDFMANWTAAAGYLPTRTDALSAWADSPQKSLASQVALSAHPNPPADVLASLAPALRQATYQILNKQGEPQSLAQEAANQLKNP
jgi:ABC-type glycerol-3-phosphate transport system substrate-binding protein